MKRNFSEDQIRTYFWSLVNKSGPIPPPRTKIKTKCWLWIGSIDADGYGRFRFGGVATKARRYAWKEKTGKDPGTAAISTLCGNRVCVRHLVKRTRAEVLASVPKAPPHGSKHPNAKVTEKQVREMRRAWSKGDVTQRYLERRYGLAVGSVKPILSRRSWKHV